jgi:hypothetical protein
MSLRGEWELSSGLVEECDFYVDRARFGYRENYMQGTVPLLILEGHSPDSEVEEVVYPIGTGWRVVANGARIEHESGEKKRIVRTSMYGRLISRVVEELGHEGLMDRGSPYEAKVWVGYGFHLRREKFEFKGLEREGRQVQTERLMPVQIIRTPDEARSEAAPESGPAEDKVKASPALLATLIKLARSSDRSEFQARALEVEGVVADQNLLADVLDDSETGFWARYHKG